MNSISKMILKGVLVLVIVFSYSCDTAKKDKKSLDQIDKTEVKEVKEEEHTESGNLVLDNGKPWIANPETTTGVENMINILNSFTEKDQVEAYVKLTEKLKDEFSMIFQKCSMTGEAHNQLHNFLVPIKDLLETLPSSDLKQCQDSYSQLNEQLAKYTTYFK